MNSPKTHDSPIARTLFAIVAGLLLVLTASQAQFIQADTTLQTRESQNLAEMVWEDVEIGFNDGIGFFTAPARFETSDWLIAGGIVGVTVGVMVYDPELREISLRNKRTSPTWRTALDWGEDYGTVAAGWAIGGGLYITGLASDYWLDGAIGGKGELRTLGRLVGQSLTYSGLVAVILRSLIGRERPNEADPEERNHWDVDFFNWDASENAFPSGHTTIVFAISTAIAEYLDTWLARAVMYSAAGIGTYTRFISDGHWTSDIVAGAALGYFSGRYVVDRERARGIPTDSTTPEVSFYPAPNSVHMVIRF